MTNNIGNKILYFDYNVVPLNLKTNKTTDKTNLT